MALPQVPQSSLSPQGFVQANGAAPTQTNVATQTPQAPKPAAYNPDLFAKPGEDFNAYSTRMKAVQGQQPQQPQQPQAPMYNQPSTPTSQPSTYSNPSSSGMNSAVQSNDPNANYSMGAAGSSAPTAGTQPQAPQNLNPRSGQIDSLMQQLQGYGQLSPEETNAQKQLGDLNASLQLGKSDVNGQVASMEFKTGETANLESRAEAAMVSPQNQLALAQAKRQAALQATGTALDAQTKLYAAEKPVTLGIGDSLVNPYTGASVGGGGGFNAYAQKQAADTVFNLGQTYPDAGISYDPSLTPEQNLQTAQQKAAASGSFYSKNVAMRAIVNPVTGQISYYDTRTLGQNGGGATPTQGGSGGGNTPSPSPSPVSPNSSAPSGIDALAQDSSMIGTFAYQYATTGEMPTAANKFPAMAAQAAQKVQKAIPGFNPAVVKANAAAIKDLTDQRANTQAAFAGADANFPLLLNVMQKAGINDFNSPIANQLEQAFNKKLIGSGEMASFQALTTSLQTEYSRILARGGQVSDKTRGEAQQIVNGSIGVSAMKDLYATLKQEAGNVLGGYDQAIKGLMTGASSPTSNSGGGTSGGGLQSEFSAIQPYYQAGKFNIPNHPEIKSREDVYNTLLSEYPGQAQAIGDYIYKQFPDQK